MASSERESQRTSPTLAFAAAGPGMADLALLAGGDDVFRRLAASAPVGLVVATPYGSVRLANGEAARILGGAWRLPAPLHELIERGHQPTQEPAPAGPGGTPNGCGDALTASSATVPAPGETVVIERGSARLEVRCQVVDAPWLAPLRVAWLTDVTRAGVIARRLAAIATASATVADVGNLAATLDVVAAEIVRADDIAAAQIITLDETGRRVRLLGTAGFRDTTNFVPLLFECQALGADLRTLDCAASGQVIVVPHRKKMVMEDPKWGPLHGIMGQPDWDSFAAVPLVVDGRTVGVLNAFYAPSDDPPGREALAFLTAMAEQAALAVDRAALVSAAELQARQEERHRVAADLHDSVVQQVFSIKMRAEALRLRTRTAAGSSGTLGADELRAEAEELVASARIALDDLRRLIFELRPAGPGDEGLIEAIRGWAASVAARTGLRIEVNSDLEFIGLPAGIEDDIYRIVQEALHNVVKHAEAKSVEIDIAVLGPSNNQFVVDIVDDGVGFRHVSHSGTSLGTVSMRERAARWGGTVVLRSRSQRGGHVRVTIPLTSTALTAMPVTVRESSS